MMRFKKQFLFSFSFKTPAILSQQENIKQKCLSAVLFSSFSFFSLSFSLTWVKVSKPPNWSVEQCRFNKFNYWWNRTFTVSLFLKKIHITIQYLGIVEGKRFELYLSLTGSQFSDFFLSFLQVSVFLGAGWPQRSSSNAGFIQIKTLFQISLTRDGFFGAKSLWTNHPNHATWLT